MLDDPSAPITTTAQPAAIIHITVPRDQIQEVMGPAIQEVIAAATAQGIGPKGPVFANHFGMTPGIFNFDVGVPVSGAVQSTERVIPGEIPAATIIRTVYTGPYEGLGEAWGDFQDIIEGQGHTLGPSLWERYLSGPECGGDSSTFRTELNQTIIPS
ncbi:GyrI-like domain-containing protein [Prosthecobacter sp.]|uniref:GyrI-like domain-containing protein n=1 Tax=Prosthecobacter sp. TaxID=1965333 RepID=UPI003782D29F